MKTINFNFLCNGILFKQLSISDLEMVYDICKSNEYYYNEILKTPSTLDEAKTIFTDIPPNVAKENKYVVGCFLNNKLVGFLDIILGYPEAEVAFIGLFMVKASNQKRGIGKLVISSLCKVFANHNFNSCQIAVIAENETGLNFWKGLGFEVTSEKNTDGIKYIKMMKKLKN